MTRRAVLVRLSALGDIVHTWPLAVQLKDLGLVDELCWAVEAPLTALVEGHPAVDRVVAVDTRRWRRRWLSGTVRREIRSARDELRSFAADVCLDPQGVVKSALITAASRAHRRIGLARPFRRERLPGLAYTETVTVPTDAAHVVARNLLLARPLGGAAPARPPAPDGRWLLERSADTTVLRDPADVVIVPGGGAPSKVVELSVWSDTARRLAARGLRVVVAWGPREHTRAKAIAETAGVDLAPPTDLGQLTTVMGSASIVLGGDTGPVHLAASVGTPVVAVFLATDPARNGPLGDRIRTISCIEPLAGPGRSAAARRVRSPSADEITEAALDLVAH